MSLAQGGDLLSGKMWLLQEVSGLQNFCLFTSANGSLRVWAKGTPRFYLLRDDICIPFRKLHFMKRTPFIISFVCGVIFIFAGIVKLFPINSFEFQLVNGHITNYSLAPYFSRLLIGMEIVLGVFLLQKGWLKRLFIPAAIAVLLIFCFYLLYLMISGGGANNCGCFGQIIPMSNLAALIKNTVLIISLVFTYRGLDADKQAKPLLLVLVPVIVYAVLFAVMPIKKYVIPEKLPVQMPVRDTSLLVQQMPGEGKKPTDVSRQVVVKKDSIQAKPVLPKVASVYTAFTGFTVREKAMSVDLNAGEKIVAVLSLDCDHCLEAAKELGMLSSKRGMPKVYALFLGEKSQVQPFFEKSGTEFPYMVLPPEQFFPLLTKSPPRITFLNNGNVIAEWMGDDFAAAKLISIIGSGK